MPTQLISLHGADGPSALHREVELLRTLILELDFDRDDRYDASVQTLVTAYRTATNVRLNQQVPGGDIGPEELTPRDGIYSCAKEHGDDSSYLSFNGRWRCQRTETDRWSLERIFGGSWSRHSNGHGWAPRNEPLVTLPIGGDYPTSIKALQLALYLDRRDGLWQNG